MIGPSELGWLLFLGAVGAMDGHVFPSFLLSQPLVGGAICGALLHDFEAGILAGAMLQMLWIAVLPVGGATLPDAFLGAIAAAACIPADLQWANGAWLGDERLASVAVVGVLAAQLGRIMLTGQRALQQRLSERLPHLVQQGDAARIQRLHHLGIAMHPVRGAVGVAIVAASASPAAAFLSSLGVAAPAGRVALALAVAALLAQSRTRRWLALPGFALGGALAWATVA